MDESDGDFQIFVLGSVFRRDFSEGDCCNVINNLGTDFSIFSLYKILYVNKWSFANT